MFFILTCLIAEVSTLWTVKVIDIDRKCVLESASQHEHLAPGADMALHALYQKIQKYGT